MSSLKHPEAILAGYDGPFFPDSFVDLQKKLDRFNLVSGTFLEQIAQSVPGFSGRTARPTTSDGYTWAWSLDFSEGLGEVVILIPHSYDGDRTDGTKSDRSIAIYTHGDVDEVAAAQVVHRFTLAVERRAHHI